MKTTLPPVFFDHLSYAEVLPRILSLSSDGTCSEENMQISKMLKFARFCFVLHMMLWLKYLEII